MSVKIDSRIVVIRNIKYESVKCSQNGRGKELLSNRRLAVADCHRVMIKRVTSQQQHRAPYKGVTIEKIECLHELADQVVSLPWLYRIVLNTGRFHKYRQFFLRYDHTLTEHIARITYHLEEPYQTCPAKVFLASRPQHYGTFNPPDQTNRPSTPFLNRVRRHGNTSLQTLPRLAQ